MIYYLTTPIYYVNAEPHLGHAYTTVVADALARLHRLLGVGDPLPDRHRRHGDKVVEAAVKAGLPVKDFVDRVSARFRQSWDELDISYDHYIRTTDPAHVKVVQEVLSRVHEAGDIYFGEYGGLYCYGCETFYLERGLIDGRCPTIRPSPPTSRKRLLLPHEQIPGLAHRLHQRQPRLDPPGRYRNEVLAFLREPLEDLCISRPKQPPELGHHPALRSALRHLRLVRCPPQLPLRPGLSRRETLYKKFWPAQHLIAKDILKPHAIYWPTMLAAMGLEPFAHLNVHGYWQMDTGKMSKSLGNVVEPRALTAQYGVDQVRYFFLREMVFGLDAHFSLEALVARINADLANDLGDLVARSLGMAFKYRQGVVPAPNVPSYLDQEVILLAERAAADFLKHFPALEFSRALSGLWEFIGHLNRYIVASAPWELAKQPEAAEPPGHGPLPSARIPPRDRGAAPGR